jgi:uncharacterized membrane protein YgcG
VPVPAGEGLSARERGDIAHAVRTATELCGYPFTVHISGADEESRPYAEGLHAALPQSDRAVLVFIDPGANRLEIVTGAEVRRVLADDDCALVALTMQSAFAAGDLVGGTTAGILQLAEHARRPTTVHTDTP